MKARDMSTPARILITGATSGLGWEMAHQFAARGNPVLAAGRRAERLAELSGKDGMDTCQLDLSSAEAISEFCKTSEPLSGLVLNAGVTFCGAFETGDYAADAALVQTNVTANLQLLRGLLPALKAGGGRILIIASLGGLTPLPYQAVYSGSKAFMINFGLALREELKAQGIKVSVFAPGGIKTEMTDIPAMKGLEGELAPAEKVAAQALKAFDKMPALTVPGGQNKAVAWISKILPRSFMAHQTERIYKKSMNI